MPALATSLGKGDELKKEGAKNGICLLNKDERKLMDAIKSLDAPKKTSVNIDPELWNRWLHFVLDKTGSIRKTGEDMENALRHYMECDHV